MAAGRRIGVYPIFFQRQSHRPEHRDTRQCIDVLEKPLSDMILTSCTSITQKGWFLLTKIVENFRRDVNGELTIFGGGVSMR